MLNLFRRALSSRVGIVIAGLLLAVIAVGFAMTDIGNTLNGSGQQPGKGDRLAKIGDEALYAGDVRQAMEAALDAERRRNPTLDMAGLIAAGGFEQVLDGLIAERAVDLFGREQGLRASKKLVDGEIASIPAFQGATGKFDQQTFLRLLRENNLTEDQLRDQIQRQLVGRHLMVPVSAAAKAPRQLALPYASLLLEQREGTLAAIPAQAMDRGADPTAAELDQFYKRNLRRFTVPERRVIRFAPFGPATLPKVAPTEAEVAKAFADRKAEFAARETRTLTQVILPTREAALALAQKVRGGAAIADAARAVGLEASNTGAIEKAMFAEASAPAVANAAFSAAREAVTDPVQSPLGWHVVRVDAITAVPARTLDQVRPELTAAIDASKTQAAIAALQTKIQDAIDEGATFDEIVAANKLGVTTTPAVTATGADPDKPDMAPPPQMAEVLRPAFDAEADDDPAVVPVGPPAQQSFALMDVVRILPPAPRPLTDPRMKEAVTADFIADRQSKAARAVALAVIAKVSKGMALDQALREVGRPLPPTQPIGGPRLALMQGNRQIDPTEELLFSMRENSVKLLAMPNRAGFFVVRLQKIIPGDANAQPQLVTNTQRSFDQTLGGEYAEQFAVAARTAVGVVRDDKAIAKLKRELSGAPAAE
ncbi:peptidylprolyl isomerase [Sphingomonas sanxanigenens]|uniref:Parvulin-like PPIase n=1 Tax=Sphingomonas sanxanigenens DSM 19645 = NX02 TaxID=1123269 RepID=W0ADR6_9SPHN|nr:peptidylprolyl isomerase [Sphingomonas sanxanigenens]AHE55226.1 hypothetical protein NX02_17760 [Sphingomonas sanxanigenens DSM 19645 = NX02]